MGEEIVTGNIATQTLRLPSILRGGILNKKYRKQKNKKRKIKRQTKRKTKRRHHTSKTRKRGRNK